MIQNDLPNNKIYTLSDILGKPCSQKEALDILKTDPEAYQEFQGYNLENQEKILDFIQGNRGLPILYDSFFKKILDPVETPERLEDFLSLLLGQKVTIAEVLTKEGSQLVEQGSLVIMDIIVRLADGSFVDVEMQRYGYAFAGERSTCYLSDLIMRQYNRVRSIRKKKFSYKDMKPVYLIVLMQKSNQELKDASPYYIHRSRCTFDSGANLNLLTNLLFISLDTFKVVRQNIDTELDAWLTFLSSDAPEDILMLVHKYPKFLEYYNDMIEFRTNPRELMRMFSRALLEMDKNTEEYMFEEMQKEYQKMKEEYLETQDKLQETKDEYQKTKDKYLETQDKLQETKDEYQKTKDEYQKTKDEYQKTKDEYQKTKDEYQKTKDEYQKTQDELLETKAIVEKLQAQLALFKQQEENSRTDD